MCLKPGALYRNEDHPKAIRLDPLDGTVTIYNPADVNFYGPIVSLVVNGFQSALLSSLLTTTRRSLGAAPKLTCQISSPTLISRTSSLIRILI